MNKKCLRCKESKPINEYPKSKYEKDGLGKLCKPCNVKHVTDWQRKNPAKYQASARRRELKRNYNITPEDYQALSLKQNGKCSICGSNKPGTKVKHLLVDHDHRTGKVRGLLCVLCNRGLGYFKDNQEILVRAAVYLNR